MRGHHDEAPEISALARARAELLGAARLYSAMTLSPHGGFAITERTAEHALCEAGQEYARAAAAVLAMHMPAKKRRAR